MKKTENQNTKKNRLPEDYFGGNPFYTSFFETYPLKREQVTLRAEAGTTTLGLGDAAFLYFNTEHRWFRDLISKNVGVSGVMNDKLKALLDQKKKLDEYKNSSEYNEGAFSAKKTMFDGSLQIFTLRQDILENVADVSSPSLESVPSSGDSPKNDSKEIETHLPKKKPNDTEKQKLVRRVQKFKVKVHARIDQAIDSKPTPRKASPKSDRKGKRAKTDKKIGET